MQLKLIQLKLILAVSLVSLVIPSVTQAAPIAVSIPTNLSTTTGATEVHVPIQTSHIDSVLGVISADIEVAYDPAVLAPNGEGATLAGTLTEGSTLATNTTTPGTIILGINRTDAISGSGVLVYLLFDVISTNPSDSSFLNLVMVSLNEDEVASTTSNGDIALPVTLGSFWADASEESITLQWQTLSEFSNLGFAIYRRSDSDSAFTQIGFVRSHGDSSYAREYRFVDGDTESGRSYSYFLEDISFTGTKNRHALLQVVMQPNPSTQNHPTRFRLLQNYPNPFNPETWIPFELAEATEVSLAIRDSLGRVVKQFELGVVSAGLYVSTERACYWDGRDEAGRAVASGVYYYTLHAGAFTAMRRLVILK